MSSIEKLDIESRVRVWRKNRGEGKESRCFRIYKNPKFEVKACTYVQTKKGPHKWSYINNGYHWVV